MSTPAKKANPMVTPNKVGLTKKDYQGIASTLCTGCGHDSITMHIVSAFYELDIEPHNVAKFSGIGCSSKTPAYFLSGSFGFNAVHGRMPSVATGAHLMNHDMVNIAVSGDGDTASIGIGQFIHLIRRNIPLLYIVENNGVYGLTKGQFSATADKNSALKKGDKNPFEAIDLCSLALDMGCDYVGRSFSGDVKQALPLIKGGIVHEGTAILDIISPCITFNNHEGSTRSYPYVKQHEEYLQEVGFVHGAKEIEVDYAEGEVKTVKMHDGSKITLKKLERDYDPTDRKAAMNMLEDCHRKGLLLTGLFYVNPDTLSFKDVLNVSKSPLVAIDLSDLKPPKASLDEAMAELA
jgi:2-oxoglutarate ferredoxin oxidoreductase subunit beta